MTKINQFFLFCSGAYIPALRKCPTENNKYVGIGATVFFTGIFASIAAFYAVYLISDKIILSIAISLLWGLMIFNMDRLIVSSIKKTGNLRTDFIRTIPRIILAIFISIVIAKPLELKVFEKEINEELIFMSKTEFTLQEKMIDSLYNHKRSQEQALISFLKTELKQKENNRNEKIKIAQEEADGTGGSQKRNLGPIYKIKKAAADGVQSEYEQLKSNNSKLIKEHLLTIKKLNEEQKTKINSIYKTKADGIAARLVALKNLSTQNEVINYAQIFITLLFLLVETAPIFIKIIIDKGPYDTILTQAELEAIREEN